MNIITSKWLLNYSYVCSEFCKQTLLVDGTNSWCTLIIVLISLNVTHCCVILVSGVICILWIHELQLINKKAVLSQRWPRNAYYTWVPWKFLAHPDYAHGYYSQHFSRASVPIDPLNVPTKFEVRSFIRSWDNRGYPKNLDSPWIRPRSLFSKILMGFYSNWPCKCTRQIWSP